MDDEYHPIGDSFSIHRSISHGFLALRTAAGPMWLAGMLLSISDGCNGGSGDLIDLADLGDDDDNASSLFALPARASAFLAHGFARVGAPAEGFELVGWIIGAALAFVLAVLLIGAMLFALNCWLQTGFVRLHVSILERASDELGPLFSGKDRFWHMAGYKALAGLALWATVLVAVWPGALLAYYGYARDQNTLLIGGLGAMVIVALPAVIYVALGMYLGELVVALDGATPVHALRRSWALARGNRMPLLGFGFVCALVQFVSLAGLLLCCVGVLATVPFGRSLVGFAKTESYLLFTRGPAQTAGFALWRRQAEEDRPTKVEGWGGPPPMPPAGAGPTGPTA
jgi:hypothetical protein